MTIIQTTNLTKTYGRLHALNELSIEVEENKIIGLIGRNGAGKTTLLRLIAGHLKPSAGEIKVFSKNPFNSLAVAAQTILVDDTMAFPASFTLSEILKEMAPFYPNWNEKIAQGLFDYFNLNPKQKHHNLSKGGKSIFNSIIGIAARCPLTLFDEPTTGMDSAVRKDFYRALLKDYLAFPRTIILSSHLLGEVEEILEEIILLKNGTCCLHMPVLELKEYAVGIKGNREDVLAAASNKAILYQEEFGKDHLYAVIKKKDFAEVEYEQKGLEIVNVAMDDLCNFLTAGAKGGINDVFARD